MRNLCVFAAGFLFAMGLGVSGMTDANKVIGFLNVAGTWDPSLAFVMVGAIAVHMATYRLIIKRSAPIFSDLFLLPTMTDINPRLVGGAALFGVGWGLGGFCPGPAVVSSTGFGAAALAFTVSMLVGMVLFHAVDPDRTAARAST
jgi:uncharacterized membrane protein YedE/YeeE